MEKLIKYDRFFIIFSVLPFAYLAYLRLPHIFNSFPVVAAILNSIMLIVFSLLRHKPVDVTTRPRDWIVTLFSNSSSFLTFFFGELGFQMISIMQSGLLSLLSLLVMIFARFHIGRNIGFVPAKRNRIVVGSVYKFIRHPIYAAMTLNLLSWLLSRFSFVNFCISVSILFLFSLNTYCEEQYLMKFPEYVEYSNKVKYRFIPFVF